jgi:hypothetical protein
LPLRSVKRIRCFISSRVPHRGFVREIPCKRAGRTGRQNFQGTGKGNRPSPITCSPAQFSTT